MKVVQVVTQCVLLGHAKKKFVLKLELESLKVYFGEKGGNNTRPVQPNCLRAIWCGSQASGSTVPLPWLLDKISLGKFGCIGLVQLTSLNFSRVVRFPVLVMYIVEFFPSFLQLIGLNTWSKYGRRGIISPPPLTWGFGAARHNGRASRKRIILCWKTKYWSCYLWLQE